MRHYHWHNLYKGIQDLPVTVFWFCICTNLRFSLKIILFFKDLVNHFWRKTDNQCAFLKSANNGKKNSPLFCFLYELKSRDLINEPKCLYRIDYKKTFTIRTAPIVKLKKISNFRHRISVVIIVIKRKFFLKKENINGLHNVTYSKFYQAFEFICLFSGNSVDQGTWRTVRSVVSTKSSQWQTQMLRVSYTELVIEQWKMERDTQGWAET